MPLPRLKPLAACLSLALAAGCATGLPGRVQPGAALKSVPAIAPAATAQIEPGISIERWWTHFGDAALERLMEEALAHNEDLESAIARVREAQASLDIARAAEVGPPALDRNPRLDLGGRRRGNGRNAL